jgi:hypothetical protein
MGNRERRTFTEDCERKAVAGFTFQVMGWTPLLTASESARMVVLGTTERGGDVHGQS